MNRFSKTSLLVSALSSAAASFVLAGCVSGEKAGVEEKANVGQVQQAALNAGTHSTYAAPFVSAGYQCKVNDEFGGVSGGGQAKSYVDSAKWTFQNLYVNNELQNYTNRQCVDMPTGNWNYCVENGLLTIRATDDQPGDDMNCASNPACATYFNGAGAGKPYSSGRMMSQHKVALKNGYVEFRARLPFQGVAKQSGAWPAIWFLGDMLAEGPAPSYTCQWPTITDGCWPWQPELDLMEWQSPNGFMASNAIFIGADTNMDACNNWPEGGSPECTGFPGSGGGAKQIWKVNDWSAQGSQPVDGSAGTGYQGWHTYGLEWTDTVMRPWVDGVSQGTVNLSGGASEYKQPMFIIMNLAIGGDLGGVVQITDWSKLKLEVDYMRWYQMGGTDNCTDPSGGPPPPPPPTARNIANNLEAESNDLASNVQFETTTDTGGGQNAGWIGTTSFIQWLINVPTTGNYSVTTRSASWAAGTSYAILVDGTQRATNSFANTGATQTWQSFTTTSFNMSAGTHTLRIAFTSANQNLNWVKVNNVSCTPTTCAAQGKNCGSIPDGCSGTLNCGNCTSPQTCAGGGVANVCGGGAGYALGSLIQAESGTQVGTTLENANTTVGFFDSGDSICFANVNMANVTGLNMRIAGVNAGGDMEVRLDSATGTLLGSYDMVATGGWATWADRSMTLSASSGVHTLCLKAAGTGVTGILNIDNVTLTGGACTPTTCAVQGKNCGSIPNGCGGTLACGNCGTGQSCTNNVCAASCSPTTCAAQGKNCGSISDGCGATLNCGSCSGGQVCNANVCAASCTPTTCAALGKNCGSVANGCGGTLNCGSCTSPAICGGGGTANVCGTSCTPTTCAVLGKNCGSVADGCGGTLSCGSCTSPATCGGGGAANVCGSSGGNCSAPAWVSGTSYVDDQIVTKVCGGTVYAGTHCWGNANKKLAVKCGPDQWHCDTLDPGDGNPTSVWSLLAVCP